MNKPLIATILFCPLFALALRAQSPPPLLSTDSASPTPIPAPTLAQIRIDPEKETLIRLLLKKNQEAEMAAERIAQSLAGMKQMMPRVPEKYWVQYRELISVDELRNRLVRVYDKHFTTEELKGILEFYNSAAGSKLAAETLPILRESMAVAQEFSKSAGETVAKEFRTEQLLQQPRAAGSIRMPPVAPANVSPLATATPSPR